MTHTSLKPEAGSKDWWINEATDSAIECNKLKDENQLLRQRLAQLTAKQNYIWTAHALDNLRKRIGPNNASEGNQMLSSATRLTKSEKKKVKAACPINAKIYMGSTFKGRYFVKVANRYIFVISSPLTVITCWDMEKADE
jgi:hypothetical protein